MTKKFLKVIVICLVSTVRFPLTDSLDLRRCNQDLGMHSQKIPDTSLSASSSVYNNLGPDNARLNLNHGGGAWCPKDIQDIDIRPYIEVDLHATHLITAISLQGRYAKGLGLEYVEQFQIEYFRPSLNGWISYSKWDGKRTFQGNQDPNTVVNTTLTPPIHAVKMRILPIRKHRRTVCMRMELYGCIDDTGIVSYSMTKTSNELGDHTDRKYDGIVENEYKLSHGLGLLTDGQVGGDFFNIDINFASGSGWVAWMNDSSYSGYVELVFEFDHIRNISKTDLFSNNYFSRNVQLFDSAIIYFSIGGEFFNGNPVFYGQPTDTQSEKARNVTIHFKNGRIAKFVKLRLFFASMWIMLSEVYFTSEIVNIEVPVEKEQITFEVPAEFEGKSKLSKKEKIAVTIVLARNIEFIIGSLSISIILLAGIFVFLLVVNRKTVDPGCIRSSMERGLNLKNLFVNFTLNNPPPSPEPLPVNLLNQNQAVIPINLFDEESFNGHRPGLDQVPAIEYKPSFVNKEELNSKAIVSLSPPSCTFIRHLRPNAPNDNDLRLDMLGIEPAPRQQFTLCQENRRTTHGSLKAAFTAARKNRRCDWRNERYMDEFPARNTNMNNQNRCDHRRRSMTNVRRGNGPYGLSDVVEQPSPTSPPPERPKALV